MKDTPVRSENRTGVSDCSETNSLSEPQRAEPRLNILLQSAPVRSPHGFETFPLLHKNLRTGQFRPWHAASKNACGSTALSILTDENTTGLAALSPYSSFVSNGFPVGNSHRLMPGSVTFDPCRQYRNDISLFFSRQFPPGRDAMPLGQTPPAAAGRGVLGDKDRMPAHRGLPPVIGNNGRSEACAHEICGMTPDSLHAFSLDIGDIFRFQTKSSAELGCRQPGEQRIEGFCRMGIFNHFSPQIKSATKIRTVNAFLSVPAGIFARGIPGTVSAMPIRRLPAATKFPSSDKRLSADGYTSDTYFWRSPSVRPYLKDNALQKRTFRKRSFLSGISFPSLHIRL